MFTDEFVKDFEDYGKDSEACKRAFEQLKRTIEHEKTKKKVEDFTKSRKSMEDSITLYESEISAIEYILKHEDKCLSEATKKELTELKDKISADTKNIKNKLKAMVKESKINPNSLALYDILFDYLI